VIGPVGAYLDEWCAMLAGAMAAETGGGPDGPALAARIRAERPDAGIRRWAAVEDATVVGVAQSSPDGEDRFVRLYVPGSHRGRGIGSALLDAVREGGVSLKGIAVQGSGRAADHRRRGLGVAVKRALAARLHAARPDITTVTTTVNAGNTPMLALNERVGYRPVRTRLLLRLPGSGPAAR